MFSVDINLQTKILLFQEAPVSVDIGILSGRNGSTLQLQGTTVSHRIRLTLSERCIPVTVRADCDALPLSCVSNTKLCK